jgi:hypothetical protein
MDKNYSDFTKTLERWFSTLEWLIVRVALLALLFIELLHFVVTRWHSISN